MLNLRNTLQIFAAEKPPAKENTKPTKVSGYTESPIAKQCGTCKYITADKKQCGNAHVIKDPDIPEGPNGLKMVSASNGLCKEWEPGK